MPHGWNPFHFNPSTHTFFHTFVFHEIDPNGDTVFPENSVPIECCNVALSVCVMAVVWVRPIITLDVQREPP
jgi:hypothetical protein